MSDILGSFQTLREKVAAATTTMTNGKKLKQACLSLEIIKNLLLGCCEQDIGGGLKYVRSWTTAPWLGTVM